MASTISASDVVAPAQQRRPAGPGPPRRRRRAGRSGRHTRPGGPTAKVTPPDAAASEQARGRQRRRGRPRCRASSQSATARSLAVTGSATALHLAGAATSSSRKAMIASSSLSTCPGRRSASAARRPASITAPRSAPEPRTASATRASLDDAVDRDHPRRLRVRVDAQHVGPDLGEQVRHDEARRAVGEVEHELDLSRRRRAAGRTPRRHPRCRARWCAARSRCRRSRPRSPGGTPRGGTCARPGAGRSRRGRCPARRRSG